MSSTPTTAASESPIERIARERLVRYADLRPCRNAFVDAYTPGSDQKENFTIIGPGVAEHPDQFVHITEPHGFNIGGARQPPGCTNSQHSHKSEEVFIVFEGQWAFRWGENAEDGEAILGPGDCISIPVNVFRGFENVGDSIGYLFAVLGGDDPGRVLWAPRVFDGARDHGLVLLENGQLVDTAKGEAIPDGLAPMPKTTAEQVALHRRMTEAEMRECVALFGEQIWEGKTTLAAASAGVVEIPIIGAANTEEAIPAGKLDWPHGFHVRRLNFSADASTPVHARQEPEVVFVFAGSLRVATEAGVIELDPGDVFTTPVGMEKRLFTQEESAVAYVVRGGMAPAAPLLRH